MGSQRLSKLAGAVLASVLAVTGCTRTPPTASTVAQVPSPIATARPRPTETAVPLQERLRLAVLQESYGNYETATGELRALVDASAPADVRCEALRRLGHCQLLAGDNAGAAQTLARFLAEYPNDAQAPAVAFWLAQARLGLGDGRGAAEAYRLYLERRPLLTSYVQGLIGDALAKAGDMAGATSAYRAAANAETDSSRKADLLEKLSRALVALKRYDEAVATDDEILSFAQNATFRAQIMFQTGAALRDAGRRTEAAERWNALVATYPMTPYAAQALSALDGWGVAAAGALVRAQVEYGAGRYQNAVEILRALIDGNPAGHTGDAHYWAALTYRQLGQHATSVREFDALIASHPQNSLLTEAWYQKAESQLLAGSVDEAVGTFRALAARYPQSTRAIQALWRVAQAYDDAGRSEEAAAAYAQAATTYPGASYAADARFHAGLADYVAGRTGQAMQRWSAYLPQEQDPAMRARLLLWLGKAAVRQGDAQAAHGWWTQAVAAQPEGFWGLRARDLMAGRSFGGQAPQGAFDPARYAPRGTPAEAEAWLKSWAPALAEGRLPGQLPPSVAGSSAFQRGMELWALGDAAAAQSELRQVQAACKDDPWALYALALYARDQGLYMPSILAASRLLALAPAAARAQAPRLVQELAYPTYYADLVLPAAQATQTDPLLFFALIYQESLFDSHATSRSDARGLAQVIPSTGQYIAGKLGDATFAPEKLWRPAVSVRYGLWYLAAGLSMFHDDALMALVGYNAGPTNAAKWGQLAEGDPDLYFERVSNEQPRTYVQRIYEHRAHYEQLYR